MRQEYFSTTTQSPSVLRRGSRGAEVRELQEGLNIWLAQMGKPRLIVDGIFGPLVESAVRAFQSIAGLVVDGIVGSHTQQALSAFRARNQGGATQTTPVSTSSRAQLAQQVLNHPSISLWKYSPVNSNSSDGADALSNVRDTANNGVAKHSHYGNAPGRTVYLDARMLDGMLRLANDYDIQVTSIAGGSHRKGSLHYAGVAFDVAKIDEVRVTASNPYYRALMQRCRDLGAIQVLGPGNKDHDTHVHCAWPRP
jgi:peptidoglycan hydrolase-like protein with peptidoglycan-binding domain